MTSVQGNSTFSLIRIAGDEVGSTPPVEGGVLRPGPPTKIGSGRHTETCLYVG